MESDERHYIKSNLPELITQTNCTEVVLAKLERDGILSCNEAESLRVKPDKFDRASVLYGLVQTRHKAFPTLAKILHEERQTGAAAILGRKLDPTAFDDVSKNSQVETSLKKSGLLATRPPKCENGTPEKIRIPLVSVNVKATVVHCVAEVCVTQVYCNYGKNPIEAVYYFPVFPDGAVTLFEAELEGRKLKSKVMSSIDAIRFYQSAVRNQTSVFLGQECGADVFKVVVGFLKPGATVKIYIEYVTEVKNELGRNTIRFSIPTTIAPRYVAPDESGDKADNFRSMEFSPDSPAPLKISVDVMIQGGTKLVVSPSHGIVVNYPNDNSTNGALKVDVEAKTTAMDRDFVLIIVPNEAHEPKLYSETGKDGSTAVMLHLVPSFQLEVQKSELIFLLDRSSSMAGHKMEMAKKALLVFLHSILSADCFFNIVGFGSTNEFLFPTSVQYDDDNLRGAKVHAKAVQANLGGSDIFSALEEIYRSSTKPGYLRQIFLLTDGDVTNTNAVIGITAANAHTTRVFVLGIGEGASRHLVEGVAKAGGGISAFVQGNEGIDKKIVRLLKCGLKPSLTDIKVRWNGYDKVENKPIPINEERTLFDYKKVKARREIQSKSFQQAPGRIPPIFNGSQMVVIGLFRGKPPKIVDITAQAPDGPRPLRVKTSEVQLQSREIIHRLGAAKLVRELEAKEARLDFEGENPAKVELLRNKIIELACRHGISSKFTAFLVLDDSDVPCQKIFSKKSMSVVNIPLQLPSQKPTLLEMDDLHQFDLYADLSSEVYEKSIRPQIIFKFRKKIPRGSINPLGNSGMWLHHRDINENPTFTANSSAKSECDSLTYQLIDLQLSGGGFLLNEDLSCVLGMSLEKLHKVARDKDLSDIVFGTALAVVYFQRKLHEENCIWELVMKKAQNFLEENAKLKTVDEVIHIAEVVITTKTQKTSKNKSWRRKCRVM